MESTDDAQTESESASTAEMRRGTLLGFVVPVLSALVGVTGCGLPLVAVPGVVGVPGDAGRRWYLIRALLLLGLATFVAGAFLDRTALLAGSVILFSAAVVARRDSE